MALWLCGRGLPQQWHWAGPATELYLQPIGQPAACPELSAFPGLRQAKKRGERGSGGLERRGLGPVQSHDYEAVSGVQLAVRRRGRDCLLGLMGPRPKSPPSVLRTHWESGLALLWWVQRVGLGQRKGTCLILQAVLSSEGLGGGRDDPQSPACHPPAVARPHKRSQLASGCPCHLGKRLLGCWPLRVDLASLVSYVRTHPRLCPRAQGHH